MEESSLNVSLEVKYYKKDGETNRSLMIVLPSYVEQEIAPFEATGRDWMVQVEGANLGLVERGALSEIATQG